MIWYGRHLFVKAAWKNEISQKQYSEEKET
jgi:hypothetical protein